MKFGPIPTEEAEGAILAHSVHAGGRRLRKGRTLSATDTADLLAAGVTEITVARPDTDDVPEDRAAGRIAAAIIRANTADEGVTVSDPTTGRANLFAAQAGLVEINTELVHQLNGIDEGITLATLEPLTRVHPRQMIATVKIIPYAVPETAVAAAEHLLKASRLLRLRPFVRASAGLILTRTTGMGDKLLEKAARAVRNRAAALGMRITDERIVAHDAEAIADALGAVEGEIALILTGSATSDRADAGPAGLVAAGGRVTRFGMPVDPGNLLFLGTLGRSGKDRPVLGLPGCARAPGLNGADWVLERIAADVPVGADEIAAMGVGGLLKEMPARPSPRVDSHAGEEADPESTSTGKAVSGEARGPEIAIVLLAAGRSRRMGGRDKLMETVDGEPMLRRMARAALAGGSECTIVVLRENDPREAALDGLDGDLIRVINLRAEEGMGTSIAEGIRALGPKTGGALILPADMPEIGSQEIDQIIAAFDPEKGREIVRATTADGRPGHPVLFGRRFFEPLAALDGDQGAREILRAHAGFVTEVALAGEAALTDLDTEKDWKEWRLKSGKTE